MTRLALLAVVAVLALPGAAAGHDQYQGLTAREWAGRAVQARRDANQAKRDANARGHTIRRLQREQRARWRPTVDYALRLATTVYGVNYFQLRSVAWCESRHYPLARNGPYRGLFQEGPMFEQGPFGTAGFSVWDPVANALTAAHTVAREGWRQWTCQP